MRFQRRGGSLSSGECIKVLFFVTLLVSITVVIDRVAITNSCDIISTSTIPTVAKTTLNNPNDEQSMEWIVHQCQARTNQDMAHLKKEISDYEKSSKFQAKINEVKGGSITEGRENMLDFIKEYLDPGMNILDLGAAAGIMLQKIHRAYDEIDRLKGTNKGKFVGVELTTGWVKFAQDYFKNIKEIEFYEGDATDIDLKGQTFDFIMMNDVAEHIQKTRYGCLFSTLKKLTHPGSLVYFHTPTPMAQLEDSEQYFENVLPNHLVISGMAMAGFELMVFQHDLGANCGTMKGPYGSLPRPIRNAPCVVNEFPKYYHAIFMRSDEDQIFELS